MKKRRRIINDSLLEIKNKRMNKKLIAGTILVLAAGIATYIYNRKKNRLSTEAADAYDSIDDTMDNTMNGIENQIEHTFS